MPTYNNIKQIRYYSSNNYLSPAGTDKKNNDPAQLSPYNASGSQTDNLIGLAHQGPYQQIVLNRDAIKFSQTTAYYLHLELPVDEIYDLNFALHLVGANNEDLDSINYQFVRYLNLPKTGSNDAKSRVILYQERNTDNTFSGDVKVAITLEVENRAKAIEKINSIGINNFNFDDTIFYFENGTSDSSGNDDGSGDKYWKAENTSGTITFKLFNSIVGFNDTILAHTWLTSSGSVKKTSFDIIFQPNDANLQYIYLYLVPEQIDNDIYWTDNGQEYYGRHIDTEEIVAKLYTIKNLLSDVISNIDPNKASPIKFGIWGHSELMFTINGEEIKIGPSEYYELRDFEIYYLGVVARDSKDKFTIDIQY